MANTKECETCKGSGTKEYVVNLNDDKKETAICHVCKGKGKIHYMSDDDERDYHADYW